MSIQAFPALQVTTERAHLIQERGHALPESLAEFECDILLAKLAEAIRPGARPPTKELLAEVVIEATRLAHERAQACLCRCGHRFSDHVSGRGCFECGCTNRRPHATELAPGGEPR